eukprot:scaffold122907_cov42-Phaeocystis_antarctica.AAC.1
MSREVWQACWDHRRRGWLAGCQICKVHPVPIINMHNTPCLCPMYHSQTRRVRVVLGRVQAAPALGRPARSAACRSSARVVDRLSTREVVVELSAGLDSAACEGPKGTTRDGVCVRTGTAGSILLLILGWIVFTEVSSSRSGSGLAAGIFWCSGIILLRLRKKIRVRLGCARATRHFLSVQAARAGCERVRAPRGLSSAAANAGHRSESTPTRLPFPPKPLPCRDPSPRPSPTALASAPAPGLALTL